MGTVPIYVVGPVAFVDSAANVRDTERISAEVLSSCHRLRSHDVAMRPSKVKGALELNDMIAFLVQGEGNKPIMSILVDSPARVTESGNIVIR